MFLLVTFLNVSSGDEHRRECDEWVVGLLGRSAPAAVIWLLRLA